MIRLIFANKTAYGLHLEPEGLRVVGVNRRGKEYLVCCQAFFPSVEGRPGEKNFPVVNLEDAAELMDGKGSGAVAAMPGDFLSIRFFQLPHMPLKEPEKAAEWEMRLLSPGQDVLVRVLRLGGQRAGGGSLVDMLGISVSRQVAGDFYLYFSASGIRLSAVEPEFIALWRLLKYCGALSGSRDEYIAAAYVGISRSVLLVCRNSAIMHSKVIPAGIKRGMPRRVSHGGSDGLLTEIEQSLKQMAAMEKHCKIDGVLLCGQAGELLAGEKKLAYKDIIFRILSVEFGGGEVLAPEMAVAAGLALRGLWS
ncbi:type IV pilus biogenesis protein PilM [Desulfocucumis palustris]|uniref:Type IV pilus biogenesis protein PilM n=1 Tax=Desulfocucumis palustris TaxID=1898651 RepID=A0A2L2XGC2_9FIRM|nr:hypothetical protein [Desulfocucumis palustris]GBF35397.1 type IV pilus biogenesis protein PilM [Desulfocucumis palustris]